MHPSQLSEAQKKRSIVALTAVTLAKDVLV
jgi:hypothetical protein